MQSFSCVLLFGAGTIIASSFYTQAVQLPLVLLNHNADRQFHFFGVKNNPCCMCIYLHFRIMNITFLEYNYLSQCW